jgi:lysyl-tRNA synthetase class 2
MKLKLYTCKLIYLNFTNKNIKKYFSSHFTTTINLKEFKLKYKESNHDNFDKVISCSVLESIAGRVISIRKMSSNLTFLDINSDCENLQIVIDNKVIDEESKIIFKNIKRGYILGLTGESFKTKSGELSLLANNLKILSECQHELPILNRKDKDMLLDPEVKYEKRYLDLIVNSSHKEIFIFRSKVIKFIRNYFDNLGFLEVETPSLNKMAGGALAQPFSTHSNSLKRSLFMRISPELYLKQLIIAGYEKVYEIGKNYINEDISMRHNPEFTSLEFYQDYSNYENLIEFTKKFLKDLCVHLFNSEKVITPNYTLNFEETNFQYFDVMKEFEIFFNKKIIYDNFEDFNREMETLYLDYINCKKNNSESEKINLKIEKLSIKKKVDKLIEYIIEPKCHESPSFILNHPTLLSPLAKAHENNPLITERFELFLNGIEVINAYSELNDSKEQHQRFVQQQKLLFDNETHPNDLDFIEALSYGMPPTAGWGLGIDRLIMLLYGLKNIKEVILFPLTNVSNK